jgi:hypothetical protein
MFCLQSNKASLDVGRKQQTSSVMNEKQRSKMKKVDDGMSATGGVGSGTDGQGKESTAPTLLMDKVISVLMQSCAEHLLPHTHSMPMPAEIHLLPAKHSTQNASYIVRR